MAITITRAGTVLTPTLVLGWSVAREARAVVHPILNTDDVEVTVRKPAPFAGDLRTFWATHDAALHALDVLAVPGAPWLWDIDGDWTLTAQATGRLALESATDDGTRWIVTVGVQEVN